MAVGESAGCKAEKLADAAAAMEMIHASSLILDDLPSMDDALLRRGQTTLHRACGEDLAILSAVALLNHSYGLVAKNYAALTPRQWPMLQVIKRVVDAVGWDGTIAGEAVDLHSEGSHLAFDTLEFIHSRKTGALFVAAAAVGGMLANISPAALGRIEVFAKNLGLAFQITDDLLNLRADPEEYGKEIGGDLWEGKRTLMLLHTLRCAEPNDQARAVAILAKRRPGADGELGLTELLDRLTARGQLSQSGRAEIEARLQGHHPSESKSLNDIRWLYELMHRVGSLRHARDVAARHAEEAAEVLASLDWLPRSHHRDVLAGLVDYVHGRTR